jgi:hypothetical protein
MHLNSAEMLTVTGGVMDFLSESTNPAAFFSNSTDEILQFFSSLVHPKRTKTPTTCHLGGES